MTQNEFLNDQDPRCL